MVETAKPVIDTLEGSQFEASVLAAFIGARLICAPYWLWRGSQKGVAELTPEAAFKLEVSLGRWAEATPVSNIQTTRRGECQARKRRCPTHYGLSFIT
jgi:hypothetical protein